jgi:lambda family phage portal protein
MAGRFQNVSRLDRAVLALSPQRGLQRIESKMRARILMNYDAASNGRRVRGWKAPASDADGASSAGRSTMRQRSRDMIRNAPFARRAQSVVTNNVVGSGISPTLTGTNKKALEAARLVLLTALASKELDARGVLNLSAMQTVVVNSTFESGEVLVLRRTPKIPTPGKLPLKIELLEVDHLNSAILSHGSNEVRDGIEYDGDGRAVAYHLYQQHPGAASRNITLATSRVPASDILHIRRCDRPEQSRGVPWLAPVMITLGEMRDYQEAQIVKQKVSSLMAAVVDGGENGVPDGASGLDMLSPGAVVYTEAGQSVTFSNPPRVDDYGPVMRLGLSAVAMGLGITYESLSGDLTGVNYSSSRVGRLEMDKNIETWQTQIMIDQFCTGVGQWALDAYRLMNARGARGLAFEWTAQRRALIDPVKEIPSILKKVDGGLSSLQREQRAMGLDPETVARERAEDAKRFGLPVGEHETTEGATA